MSRLRSSERAPGLAISDDVELPDDVQLGANVVIHAGVEVGAGCVIGDGALLGKRPVLGPFSSSSAQDAGVVVLEPGAIVSSRAIVFAGVRVCAGAVVGDQAYVRERVTIGRDSLVGRGSGIGHDVRIGSRVRIHTDTLVARHTVIEDDVSVDAQVVIVDDDAMGRGASGPTAKAAVLRRSCRIGCGALLMPGIEVGEGAFVATGAVVTRDVPSGALVAGIPARLSPDDGGYLPRRSSWAL